MRIEFPVIRENYCLRMLFNPFAMFVAPTGSSHFYFFALFVCMLLLYISATLVCSSLFSFQLRRSFMLKIRSCFDVETVAPSSYFHINKTSILELCKKSTYCGLMTSHSPSTNLTLEHPSLRKAIIILLLCSPT